MKLSCNLPKYWKSPIIIILMQTQSFFFWWEEVVIILSAKKTKLIQTFKIHRHWNAMLYKAVTFFTLWFLTQRLSWLFSITGTFQDNMLSSSFFFLQIFMLSHLILHSQNAVKWLMKLFFCNRGIIFWNEGHFLGEKKGGILTWE